MAIPLLQGIEEKKQNIELTNSNEELSNQKKKKLT
jgi:hypothetical protein